MVLNKEVHYIVTEKLEVICLGDDKTYNDVIPLLFITSTFKKKSSGQNLYSYYSNKFFTKDHEYIEEGKVFEFEGLQCEFSENELWSRSVEGFDSVTINVTIKDRLKRKQTLTFNQKSYKNKVDERFINLFDYLSHLNRLDTHMAVGYLMKKNKEIEKLKNRIENIISNKRQNIV